MSDAEHLQMQSWLHDLEEGKLSAEDHAKLEALLKQSEAARRFYVRRMNLSAALCNHADEAQESVAPDGDGEKIVRFEDTAKSRRRWPLSAKLALAASLAVCGFVVALAMRESRVVSGLSKETKDAGCAVLVDAAGAQWGNGAYQQGMSVPAGAMKLEKGIARLEFYSGASLTLEGKAELEILSVNSARLRSGRLRAHVPPHAKGFKLVTPDAEVIDLGTEFGLKVSDTGKSEVHVFEGEVLVSPDAGKSKTSLKRGAVWSVSGAQSGRSADAAEFADLTALREQSRSSDEHRLAAWRDGLQKYLHDPRLLVGYTFEPASEWDRTLRNQSTVATEATHGSIVGARWAQGRWQGKRALEFKSPGDRVRLSVPGEFDAITLAIWVQVGGIDRRFNSLFLTDSWAPGNPHWHIVRDGSFDLGVHEFPGERGGQHVFYSPKIFGPDKLGVWYHLATTFELRSGVGRHFVNGKIISEFHDTRPSPWEKIIIGNGELGNWGLPEGSKPRSEVRSFNGRMDEFLMFGSALEPAEIARLYDIGKPG